MRILFLNNQPQIKIIYAEKQSICQKKLLLLPFETKPWVHKASWITRIIKIKT